MFSLTVCSQFSTFFHENFTGWKAFMRGTCSCSLLCAQIDFDEMKSLLHVVLSHHAKVQSSRPALWAVRLASFFFALNFWLHMWLVHLHVLALSKCWHSAANLLQLSPNFLQFSSKWHFWPWKWHVFGRFSVKNRISTFVQAADAFFDHTHPSEMLCARAQLAVCAGGECYRVWPSCAGLTWLCTF